jgi:carbon starvation protein
MPALVLIGLSLVAFVAAYYVYARYIQQRILRLDPNRRTPAYTKTDGVDYVPAHKMVLFGHHFASIAGLGPILGPAIAAVWGWLPAFLWIIFGSIFLGAVHDFVAVGISLRLGGRSIGDITRDIIGPRARLLFLVVIFFVIGLFMAAFVVIVAGYLASYPQAVFPVWGLMALAVFLGVAIYKFKVRLSVATFFGIAFSVLLFYLGFKYPITVSSDAWIVTLLGYSGLASVLPVWLLLQPRDYLNSFQLYGGLLLLLVGVIAMAPVMTNIPATHALLGDGAKIPPMAPLLFVTVACGAISGFHGLVSSGTTSRQLSNEKDARFVTYGGMLTESFFAILALIACTAGIGYVAWNKYYASGGADPLPVFKEGGSGMASYVGMDPSLAALLLSVMAVGFAMTTLDTATRLLRFNTEELGKSLGIRPLRNRYLATAIAVGWIAMFAVIKFTDAAGNPMAAWRVLWPLGGASNQILAVLVLLTATVYFYRLKRPTLVTLIPLVIMLGITIWSLLTTLVQDGFVSGNYVLGVVSGALLLLAFWLAAEAVIKAVQLKRAGLTETEVAAVEEALEGE